MRFILLSLWVFASVNVANAGPAECFQTAMTEQLFPEHSYELSVQLCKGSKDEAAIQCFKTVIAEGLFNIMPERKALALCAGATDDTAIQCYRTAYTQITNPRERAKHALQLCSKQ